ncbi:MAG: gfo/Idh/MocA family oxidoreductase, partial [Planctomycetota bacterium]
YEYANGVTLEVSDEGENGILFTGDAGRLFVNRGKITGAPVEQLERKPLPREDWSVYAHDNRERPPRAGKLDAIINHMGNFIDCVRSRQQPISDVADSHRTVSTCHLGNIALRHGRPLVWDPNHERFTGDVDANKWLRREQRAGFETT